MFKPEPPLSAGALKNICYAFAYGVDAIYAGQPCYSLCVRNNEFNHENLQLGISEARALGKKFYVVVNIAPHNAKLKTSIRDLKPMAEMGLDVLAMSGPGPTMLVREHFPEVSVHLSAQANAVNWATVKFWQQVGLTHVIFSCELSLGETEGIHNRIPDMEIETFVHDVPCMAYPGRCLLSGYINERDPNQGTCTSTRRWGYNVQEGKEDDVGNIVHKYEPILVQNVGPTLSIGAPADKVFIVEEARHPGRYITAFEDEHGTCIVNSKDLRTITHVEHLTKMGVHSLKIKGCTKSLYYCARAARAYRKAIDDTAAGGPFDTSLPETLEGLVYCGYTKDFLCRHTRDNYQSHEYGYSVSDRQQFVDELTDERKGDLATVAVKNKFLIGDSLELMIPQGNINFTLEYMESAKGEAMSIAPGDGYTVRLPVPQDLKLNYALLIRNFSGGTTCDPHGK